MPIPKDFPKWLVLAGPSVIGALIGAAVCSEALALAAIATLVWAGAVYLLAKKL